MIDNDTALIGLRRFRMLAFAAVVAALAGCGVKSAPKHPDSSKFPGHYPEALPPLQVAPQSEQRERTGAYGAGPLAPSYAPSSSQRAPSGIYQYPNPSSYVPPKQ